MPPELDQICLRALARDPAERFQTAAEMQGALEAVLAATRFRRQDGTIASFLARHFAAEREAGEALIRSALEPPDPILARGTSRRRTGPQGIEEADAIRPPIVGGAPGASGRGAGADHSPASVAAAGSAALGPRGPAMGTSAPDPAPLSPSSAASSPLVARRDGAARPEALFPAARVPVGKVPIAGAAPGLAPPPAGSAAVGVVPMPGSRPNGAPATRGRGASGSQAEGADAVTEVSELLADLADGATEVAEAATHVVPAPGQHAARAGATSSSSIDVILPDGDADPLAAAGPARSSVAGNDLAPRSGETVVGPTPAASAAPRGAQGAAAAASGRSGPAVQTMDDTLDVEENVTDADLGSRPRGKGRTGRIEAITGAWSDSRRHPTARPLPLPAPPSSDRSRSPADAARASSSGDTEDDDDDFTVVDPEKSPRVFEAAANHAAALAARAAAAAPTSQTAAISVPAAVERSRPILPAHRGRQLWVAAVVGICAVAALALILYAILGEGEGSPPGAPLPGAADVIEPASSAVPAPGSPARGGAVPAAPPSRHPATGGGAAASPSAGAPATVPTTGAASSATGAAAPSASVHPGAGAATGATPSDAGAASPSSAGAASPSSAGASSPSSAGAASPSSAGASSLSSAGASSPSSAGTASPWSAGTASPSSAGAASPSSADAASPSSAGTTSPSSAGARPPATSSGASSSESALPRRRAERPRSPSTTAARGATPSRTTARITREKPRTVTARESKPARVGDPDQLYRDGARLFLAGELDQARRAFQAAIAASPRFAPAHRGLGLVFERTGDRSRAIRSLQNYLRLAPSAADGDAIRTRLDRLRR